MTKKLVLHIGDPKTGSTSIQQVLFQRQFDCPSRAVDYPKRLTESPLVSVLKDKKKASQQPKEFGDLAEWARASPADVIVLSSEQFSSVSSQKTLDAFNKYLPDLTPTMQVVAYVRPHVSRFVSYYVQATKVGWYFDDMESYFDNMNGKNGKNALIYSNRFQNWRDTFGDRFTLRPMIRDEMFKNDVVEDFLNLALDNAPFSVLGSTETNIALPLETLSGLRILQKVLRNQGANDVTRHRVGRQINALASAAGLGKGTRVKVTKALYARALEACRQDAERLDRDFFGKSVMLKALERAADDAAEDQVGAEAQQFFDRAEAKEIRRNARALAKKLQDFPGVWGGKFQRDIGQRPSLGSKNLLTEAKQTHIREVEKLLADTVALIAPQ